MACGACASLCVFVALGACVSHGVSRALCAPSSSRLTTHLLCLSVSSACLPSPPLPSALSPCLSHILPPSACLPPRPVSPACLSHLLPLSACLSPLFLLSSPVSSACLSPLTSDFAPLCLSAPSACLSHLLPLSACLSPLLLLPSPVSSACLSPLPSAPPCLSVFSACLPLAAVALHRCDGSDREPEGAAQRRQVGAVRPRAAPPLLLSPVRRRRQAGSTHRPVRLCRGCAS